MVRMSRQQTYVIGVGRYLVFLPIDADSDMGVRRLGYGRQDPARSATEAR